MHQPAASHEGRKAHSQTEQLETDPGQDVATRATGLGDAKVENLAHAVSLHFMHNNFCRKHQTLKTTPAVAAGIERHPWSLSQLVEVLEELEEWERRAM